MSTNWIFLRGLTRGVVHWGKFAEIFKQRNPDGLIEFIEIPGNGTKSQLSTPISPKKLIDHLRAESSIIANKLDYHLCGISLGGMITLKWAELYPAKLQTINTINTSLSQFSSIKERMIPQNYLKVIGGLRESDPYEREKLILSMTCNHSGSIERNLSLFAEFSIAHPIKKSNFLRQLILARRIRINQLPPIPFRVICSDHDRLVSSKCSKIIAEKLNGKLLIHPSAGHDLPLDEANWLADILLS